MSTTLQNRACLMLAALPVLFACLVLPQVQATGAGPCKQYRALNKAGYPQRVLALVDAEIKRLPKDARTHCPRQRAKAERRVARAEAEMSALELVADPEPSEVRAAVDSALASDHENARAKAKDAELEAAAKKKAKATLLATEWKTFWDAEVAPAKGWAIALLGWLIGAAIALKLLNRLLRNRGLLPPSKAAQLIELPRALVTVLSWVVVVLGGVIGLRGDWWAFGLGLLVTLIGLRWLAGKRRARPRLEITTSGETAPSAEHVRAVLHEMGSEPSRSIELPTATDATFAKEVVALPESTGAIGKLVTTLVAMMTPYCPWRLNVQASTDEVLNVELFRNYELQDAAVLSKATLLRFLDDMERAELAKPEQPGKDAATSEDPEPAAHDFAFVAAAVALTHMAKAHELKDVLGGAQSWRSVGLENLAGQMSVRDKDREKILAKAVDEDAGNVAARLAFWHQKYRFDPSPAAIRTYWHLTESAAADERISEKLRLTARYNQLVAGVNLLFADPPPPSSHKQDVKTVARLLLEEVDSQVGKKKDSPSKALARSMKWPATTLAWSAGHGSPRADDPQFEWDSKSHYNTACYLATQDERHVDVAVRHLLLAGETKDSEWLWKDPQLTGLLQTPAFLSAFGGTPRTDLLELAPFSAYADGLRKQGLTTPVTVAAANPAAMRAADVPFALIDHLQDAARFVHDMGLKLKPLRIEIAAALNEAGYRFARPPEDEVAAVQQQVVDACAKFGTTLDTSALGKFLRNQDPDT